MSTTDQRLQDARRSAALGVDPGAEARLIVERMRAGTLTMERVELAVYCADEAAWLAAGAPWFGSQGERRGSNMGSAWAECRNILAPAGLATWVQGLSRWGPDVLVRAGAAAARAALSKTHCLQHRHCEASAQGTPEFAALLAVEAWLACPCETHRAEVHRVGLVDGIQPHWLNRLSSAVAFDSAGVDISAMLTGASLNGILGEQPVREAIQNALRVWALGEQP